ncbi:MAG: hypothetical protein J6Y74_04390 [Clostridia bacterium]|nr:hypothetical protein [Clostridia bacterium]
MGARFKASLREEWLKYLIVAVLSVALWSMAFGLYHAPRSDEKIEVFFAGTVKDRSFEKVAAGAFSELRKVEIASADPSANTFAHKYELVAFNGSDVVILPESVAQGTYCKDSYLEQEPCGEMFYQEGVAYGVYLPSAAKEALGAYFDFGEERYVVLIPGSSVNAGVLTDHAFAFEKWLVGYVQA